MYTTLLPRSHANFGKWFRRVNNKAAARAASDSFHSQIGSNLHNFLNLASLDSVPLYSTVSTSHSNFADIY